MTKLLTISFVEFASGFRNDLDLSGDALQGAAGLRFFQRDPGPRPVGDRRDQTPIDFLAADGHKWLARTRGRRVCCTSGANGWNGSEPINVGSRSVVTSYNSPKIDFTLKATAERWEGGAFNMPGLQGFAESVKLFLEHGPQTVSRRILANAEAVREVARSAGWTIYGSTRLEELSSIVVIENPSVDPSGLVRAMRERGVIASCRRGRLRISPHMYNNAVDFERLKACLVT